MPSDCVVCDDPGRFDLRLQTLEMNYAELKEIFREHKKQTIEKIDRMNNYLIATLTTVVISALLLIVNLIVIYGGR